MKPPINSPGDDFSIIFEGNNFSKGYFASDRPGGKGGMDIYMFEKAPLVFTLKGIVADDSTNQPLENVLVRLKGSDGTTVETKTDKTGMYSFDKKQIKENTTYEIATVMDGYFATTAKETTVGLTESKDLVHDLKIKRMPPPEKAIELPEIYYEYDKWNLVDSSKKALDGLIAIMKENPHMVIELSSHTDSRGTDEYNNELSQKRAQSVVDYLISKGIERDRMIAKGYGKTKLKINCTECTEEQHQQNRRTEFRILSNDYIPGKGSKTQKELQQQQKKNKK